MQNFLVLFFLGLVQGLTEFLPVSSSGHLVLFSKIFKVEESMFLSILLHVATLLSIVVVFWKDIWKIIKNPFKGDGMKIIIATIPTCLIVLLIMPIVKSSFGGAFLPYCFLLTAVLLFVSDMLSKKKNGVFNTKNAIFMGIAQGFAVFPGISRSGSTICAGILSGANKKDCAKFSFLMSIPIIILSMVMEVYDVVKYGITIDYAPISIIASFAAAFVCGIFAIKFMMKLTEKGNLKWFAIYLVFVGVLAFFV